MATTKEQILSSAQCDVDVVAPVNSTATENALAGDENGTRPKIISQVTWDADGTRRSIEIEPLFGESKEACKARLTELLQHTTRKPLRPKSCVL
jgi:hypothetical protein